MFSEYTLKILVLVAAVAPFAPASAISAGGTSVSARADAGSTCSYDALENNLADLLFALKDNHGSPCDCSGVY